MTCWVCAPSACGQPEVCAPPWQPTLTEPKD